MKPDERMLITAIHKLKTTNTWLLANNLGIPYKRARYIIRDKWTDKGWVDYGVSWRYAWLTDDGITVALEEMMK